MARAEWRSLVELPMLTGGEPGLPRRREPDLAGLATFTLDPRGRVDLLVGDRHPAVRAACRPR